MKVTAPNLEITSGKGQSITVVDSLSKKQKFWQRISVGTFEFVLWVMAGVVTLMVLIFSTYTISLRIRRRKTLFEERDISDG